MYIKYIVLIIGLILQWQMLWAVMAYPYPVEVEQPDGSKLEIRQLGDEFFHYTTDREGYLIAQKKDGFYYYSDFDVQGKINIGNYRVGTPTATRSAQVPDINITLAAQTRSSRIEESMHLTQANARQAYEGRLKTIVLLVAFADKAFVSASAQYDFDRLKNELGYSDNGATGSVRDYYRDNSNNLFDPEFVVKGPYTLPYPMSYYGGNNAEGNDSNPKRMVIEAAWLANQDGVDFSEFDVDNDGYVDNIFVYYAGHNEAEGGSAESIWPHSWSVASMDSSNLDGVRLGSYACSSELKGSTGSTMTAIGTACHEYGHTLGLMDMYDTDGTESGGRSAGLGYLSLMSAGNYNNKGRTPPYLTAEERWSLGWMTPEEIIVIGQYVLPSIDQNKSYVIHTENEGEYFLLENRRQSKWDTYIEGKGLLIYHVDKSNNIVLGQTAKQRWLNNTINVYPQHQCMDLEEAGGSESRGDAYAFFPGSSGLYTEFSLSTRPSAYTWSGLPLGLEIKNITLVGGEEISFDVVKEDKVYLGGQVLNMHNKGISEAILYLKKLETDPAASTAVRGLRSALKASEVYYITHSGSDGRFMFEEELLEGTYELFCQSENYVSNSQIIQLYQGSNNQKVLLLTESDRQFRASLSWCENFSYYTAVRLEGVEAFMPGVFWSAEDLSQYAGMYIGRMTIYIATGNPSVEVFIFQNGQLLYQQMLTEEQLAGNSYCTLDLLADSLLIEPGAELILAYEVSNYASDKYPVGICSGSRVEGKGNLFSLDKGATWTTADIEGNWLISFDIYSSSDFVQMESFSVDPGELTLNVGESHFLLGQVKPSDATNWKIEWKSSDSLVVHVDQLGKLSALSPGQSTIMATTDNGNRSASCFVQVNPTISSSLDIHIAQHMFYLVWADTQADSWKLSWKEVTSSVYRDSILVESEFLLQDLSPRSSIDVIIRAYSGEQEVDSHQVSILTDKTSSDYMAIYNRMNYTHGDILLLDVMNLPDNVLTIVWKLNDEVISAPVLVLPEGIHELMVEVKTSEGNEIIRRQIKVE